MGSAAAETWFLVFNMVGLIAGGALILGAFWLFQLEERGRKLLEDLTWIGFGIGVVYIIVVSLFTLSDGHHR